MNAHQNISPLVYQPEFEQLELNESQTIDELTKTLQEISDKTAADYGRAVRSVHAKSHGLVKATLTVKSDLPEFLRQGIFASPNSYPVMLRLSTTPGDILPDSISTPRGMAIKILGVEGERLQDDPDGKNQDFLMVNGPAFLKPDAKSFLSGLKILAKTTDKAEGLKKIISAVLRTVEKGLEYLGIESATLKSLGGHPSTHLLGERFFTQVPLLYGKYMAKFSLNPVSPALMALKNAPIQTGAENGIREAVSAFFKTHSATWELAVQLCTNVKSMPIEDASVVWSEKESPYIPVATIEADSQITWDDNTFPQIDEKLSFNPWNGIAAHRPLGSVMRARRLAYERSSKFRKQFNGCPMAEIKKLEDI